MTTARFYVDHTALLEGRLVLEGSYHHHLSRVLRMRSGQSLQLMDGKGCIARGSILSISPTRTSIAVDEITEVERERPRIKLFQALPQGKKMDDVVQWSVELGADAVVPFSCRRSRSLDDAVRKRYERWRKIALESSRVAGRPFLPEINEALTWEGLLAETEACDVMIMADETGGTRPRDALAAVDAQEIGLVIGPEGGFTEEERIELLEMGARPVTLGATVLRTETAGMVLMAAVRCHYGLL